MKFLKHIRSRSKLRSQPQASHYGASAYPTHFEPPSNLAPDKAAGLPERVLEIIFSFVCPHSDDETFKTSEESMSEHGCMLCDTRDLAHAAAVCKRWRKIAQMKLYHSVRIDAVHYCGLEQVLAEKRKRRSWFEKNAEPESAPSKRLNLFQQTVRSNQKLALAVRYLKIHYMTREMSKTDLTLVASVLPNLIYIDLPEGFFSDDQTCRPLRAELQNRCPDIRRMKYSDGAAQSFTELGSGRFWQNLEELEVAGLSLAPTTFLAVLDSIRTLQALTLTDLSWLDDTIFQPTPGVAAFPTLRALSLHSIPNLTPQGLSIYLARPTTRSTLRTLSLINTNIPPSALPALLSPLTNLQTLTLTATVSHPLPPTTPLLTSPTLQTLHYEITSAPSSTGVVPPAESYYARLITALHTNALPALSTLYVRDPSFPETLLLTPPAPAFATSAQHQQQQPAPAPARNHTLAVYSKGEDSLEWSFTSLPAGDDDGAFGGMSISGPASGAGRPMSGMSSLSGRLSPVLGGGARRSMFVANGAGDFLAVPGEGGTGADRGRSGGAGGDRWGWE
ncbi:MAG: hypothetical protein M1824_004592 [Vezdaea acicularis]|nr:MAG: hypothetical protein M1824_004592 [Vezdaea acicularis]